MKGKIFTVFFLVIALFLLTLMPSYAKNDNSNKDNIPEEEGTYDVPGHSELQVNVHIYKAHEQSNAVLACADPDSLAVDGKTGWHLPLGSWNYFLNTNTVPFSGGSTNLPTIAGNSFASWSNAIGNKVTFASNGQTNINKAGLDNQNIIAWGPVSTSNAIAVTYTWYYRKTKLVAEVDTIMNDQLPWSWTSYANNSCGAVGTYDAQDILTHELGHWMGLNDKYSSAYANNTMYGYGSTGEIKKDTLATGDITAVQTIY